MRRNVILAAALAIAVALAGCSKGEDGTIDNSMDFNPEKHLKDIKEHLAGTWQHDGFYGNDYPIFDDDYFVTRGRPDDKPTYVNNVSITFRNDGTCTLNIYDEQRTVDGTYEFTETLFIHFNFENPSSIRNYLDTEYEGPYFERDFQTIYLVLAGRLDRYIRK